MGTGTPNTAGHGGRGPRGRPARLSREAVLDAAETLLERDGTEGLSMRALAREVGASTMAVYRHVRDKDELLVLLLDRAAAQVERPELPEDPRRRVWAICRLMRDELAARPWAVGVLATGRLMGPSVLWMIEEVISSFMACGLDLEEAAQAYRRVWLLMVGDLTLRSAAAPGPPPPPGEAQRPGSVTATLAAPDPLRYPALAALGGSWERLRGEDAFSAALESLLDGITQDT